MMRKGHPSVPGYETSVHTVHWSIAHVPALCRKIPVRVFTPEPAKPGCLIWAHGGSWTRGSAEEWQIPCAELSWLSGHPVVSVDYRLAPAYQYPAAVQDILAVVAWLAYDQVWEARGGIAVGGDSAGATIAACAALEWRDQERPLTAQILAYPPMDPWCSFPSYVKYPDMFPARKEMIQAWNIYLGSSFPDHEETSNVSPLLAGDLSGIPPVVLAVGTRDPVADDTRAYARRVRSFGTTVYLREFSGLGHGAFLNAPVVGRGDGRDSPGGQLRCWLAQMTASMLEGDLNV